MEYYYGNKNIIGALSEARFWKHQELEHVELLGLIVPDLEQEFVKTLKEFELNIQKMRGYIDQFTETEVRSLSTADTTKMLDCIEDAIVQSKQFVHFMGEILEKSKSKHLNEPTKHTVNHFIRESRYFVGIVETVLE